MSQNDFQPLQKIMMYEEIHLNYCRIRNRQEKYVLILEFLQKNMIYVGETSKKSPFFTYLLITVERS